MALRCCPWGKSNLSNSEFVRPKLGKCLKLYGCHKKRGKIVIFSQHVDSIKHVSVILMKTVAPHQNCSRGRCSVPKYSITYVYDPAVLQCFTFHSGAAAADDAHLCTECHITGAIYPLVMKIKRLQDAIVWVSETTLYTLYERLN